MSTIHILTHTHWDREWFLPSEYTNPWLHNLFPRLFDLIEQHPEYRYILDGQTLMVEDYLNAHPEQEAAIQQKAESGNLLLGPYYGQNDWRVVSEESLMRNLYLGICDAKRYGNLMLYGWLMDNFGHCSQSPQIHKLFGIDTVFVWRGPVFKNDNIASDFLWQGSDNSKVQATFLVSGYRNFYNLTDTTDYIEQRIKQLETTLAPFAPNEHLIFLNGYDLDVYPEDPFQFLEDRNEFIRSTPERYSQEIQKVTDSSVPVLRGELYSGKYACIFPGSLSARGYLKIENALIENLLAYYLEPMQALLNNAGIATDIPGTEALWRDLLKTQLHDNLGGVGVDQVHDSMEETYERLYHDIKERITSCLQQIPALFDLQQGKYVYMPAPFDYEDIWLATDRNVHMISSIGSGFYKIDPQKGGVNRKKDVKSYTWKNLYYTFQIGHEEILLNGQQIGTLILEKDMGDTYNADPEDFAVYPEVKILSRSLQQGKGPFTRIVLEREIRHNDIYIRTEETIFLNNTPVIDWKISITSTGKNYRLRMAYETNDTQAKVFAKMPYDICQRPRKDTNYFGEETPESLKPVLLAARETGEVSDFPFQGFVALSEGNRTKAVFAKGLREYEVEKDGTILVTLKRSVEWIAQQVRTRVGDAGPKMYVPSAKDERTTHIELAFISVLADVKSVDFLKWFYLFDYGYLVFKNESHEGTKSSMCFWEEPLPWSGIQSLEPGKSLMRVYNPFTMPFTLSRSYTKTDPFGNTLDETTMVDTHRIEHLEFQTQGENTEVRQTAIELVNFPDWPVEEDQSSIEPEALKLLQRSLKDLRRKKQKAEKQLAKLSSGDGLPYHQAKHTIIGLEREMLELELSLLLNELKINEDKDAIRQKIAALGEPLNLLRRNRRTYDYILSLFENA